MPPKALPARRSKTAPSFDGKPGQVEHYFRDVKDTGAETERNADTELINIALRYVDIDDEQLWSRKQTAGMTFDASKAEIKKLYPGSDGERLYTWTDLREVVKKGPERSPRDREEFAKYQRDLQRIADFLKDKGKISDRERNELFMKGIHSDFRFRVLQRLQIVKSTQPSDEPSFMDDIIAAAEWAIDGTPGAIYVDKDTSMVKKEIVDMSNTLRDLSRVFSTQMQSMTLKLAEEIRGSRQGQQNRPQTASYQNQQAPNQQASPNRWNQGSNGQSASAHSARRAGITSENARAGKCMRNEQGRIVLPNGWYIPRAITGNNFLDRLDKWHDTNPGNIKQKDEPPHMLYMASTVDETEEPESAEAFLNHDVGTISLDNLSTEEIQVFLETRKKTEKGRTKEVFDGVHLPPKPPSAIKRKVGFVPEVDGPAGRLPQAPLVKGAAPPNGPRPYVAKFRAPIEETIKPADLVKRALSSKFEITGKEFFAIYPEGRKFAKDLLTSKKVPVVEVAYSETSPGQPPEPQYVLRYEEENGERRDKHLTSSEIDALRVIDPLINGEHQIEAILDQGSEIIAMNRDIWLKLGVGLDPQKVLHMQSANSQSNSTAGVITDLKFPIEGVDLLLQGHVVQGASFDLLMGRPFFRFTSCQTIDNMDGSQEITITCPNTGKRVTVPTRKKTPKSRNPFRTTDGAAVGFQDAGPRN
ncbi:hypothetical protein B0H17DRAFT_955520 [Mycena rosella]|uniref:Uncharacterized protein n=1 Tax=Mycena rosella TaxID=1033263 RepID=A0AAD7G5H5_MYCRO|nr:hypothetical protein B0H17DRAFT_955520 [Mycena rosella]